MAALTTARMTRNMKICFADVAISLATRISSMSARVYASRCFQRRISRATTVSSASGASRSMTTFTVWLLAWLACTASSSPGTPGRLNAGLAAVRARSLTSASLSLRNCTSCASLQRHEDHRVAARRHHAPGQADHRVLVAADADAFVQPEPGPDIGDRLVVRARDRAPGHEVAGLARMPRLEADQHHAHVAAFVLDLHRQIGDVAGLRDAAHAEQRSGRRRRARSTARRRDRACRAARPRDRRRRSASSTLPSSTSPR